MEKSQTVILYVDDEPLNLMLFKQLLQEHYEIITAKSAPIAIEILKKRDDISLIISDMRMPEMDGLQFAKISKEEYSKLHFMLLSGYSMTPEIEDAMNKGYVSSYLRKPFDIDKIVDEVEMALGD